MAWPVPALCHALQTRLASWPVGSGSFCPSSHSEGEHKAEPVQDAAEIRPGDAEGARGWSCPRRLNARGQSPLSQLEADPGSCPWVPGPGAAALGSPPAEGEAGVQITAGSQAVAWWVWRPPAGFGCGPARHQLRPLTCSSVKGRCDTYLGVGLERVHMVKCSGNTSHPYPGSKGPSSPAPSFHWLPGEREETVRED